MRAIRSRLIHCAAALVHDDCDLDAVADELAACAMAIKSRDKVRYVSYRERIEIGDRHERE